MVPDPLEETFWFLSLWKLLNSFYASVTMVLGLFPFIVWTLSGPFQPEPRLSILEKYVL